MGGFSGIVRMIMLSRHHSESRVYGKERVLVDKRVSNLSVRVPERFFILGGQLISSKNFCRRLDGRTACMDFSWQALD